jgi:hypothetical protein
VCGAARGSVGGALGVVSDTKEQTAESQFHFSRTSMENPVGKRAM